MLFKCVSLQYIFQTVEMYGIVIFRMERYALFRLGDMDWCVVSKSWVNSPRRHRWSGSGCWMQVEIMLRSSFWVSRSGDHDGEWRGKQWSLFRVCVRSEWSNGWEHWQRVWLRESLDWLHKGQRGRCDGSLLD